jgi:predicted nucleic acid-binding protein
MNSNISLIKDASPKTGDMFLFDNNVLNYLLAPISDYEKEKQKQYSGFLDRLISRDLHIYTNALILSEFSNVLLRLDWKKLRDDKNTAGQYDDYKQHYVGSTAYKKQLQAIRNYIDNILQICQKSSDEFNSLNMSEVMDMHEKIDFNDSYYITLARKKKWTIVSDDKDIVKHAPADVKVITYKLK